MADVLQVEKREKVGTAATRRLRRDGYVPAVLYGHGQDNEHLAIPELQVKSLIRHHSKMVKLDGAVSDTALVNEVHWDPLGIEVLHLDLIRVDTKEKVEVTVPLHTRGDAVGSRSGGMLLENVHEVAIRCSAASIPEALEIDVSDLDLGGQMTAAQVTLPEGAELVTPPETVVVHVEKPKGAAAESTESADTDGDEG